ncbi:hypothetical protein Pelo_19576 [Pelomyxa schiedti]|nr:hypothetical protein Pelo_19576 [Pelomyxa schiedti]
MVTECEVLLGFGACIPEVYESNALRVHAMSAWDCTFVELCRGAHSKQGIGVVERLLAMRPEFSNSLSNNIHILTHLANCDHYDLLTRFIKSKCVSQDAKEALLNMVMTQCRSMESHVRGTLDKNSIHPCRHARIFELLFKYGAITVTNAGPPPLYMKDFFTVSFATTTQTPTRCTDQNLRI